MLLLAVPPVVPSQPGRPGAEVEHLQQLSKVVDAYSVMTYDYSASGAGPNAPLTWQEQNVQQLTAAGGSSGGAKGGCRADTVFFWRHHLDAWAPEALSMICS